MLLHLIRYEFRQLAANRTLVLLAVILAGLFGVGLWTGTARVDAQWSHIRQLQAQEAEMYARLRSQADSVGRGLLQIDRWWVDPTHPLVPGAFRGRGKYVIIPPAPLSAVATGQSDLLPYYARVNLYGVETGHHKSLEHAAHLALGDFDLAFVLVWLLPLLVIAFSYNLLSAEREQGTLPLLRAQPVAITQILLAKLLFRYLFLGGIGLLLLLMWMLVLGVSLAGAGWLSLAMLVYMACWFAAAYAVNRLGYSSAFNALALVGLWICLVVVVPAVAHLGAEWLRPVPSRVAWVNEQRAIEQRFEPRSDSLVQAWKASNPGDTSVARPDYFDGWLSFFVAQPVLDTEIEAARQRYAQAYARQQAWSEQFRFASPAIMLQQTLLELAGTSDDRLRSLEREASTARRQWWDYFAEKFLTLTPVRAEDYDQTMPTLGLADLPVAWRLTPGNLVGMLVYALLALVLGGLLSRRAA